MKLNNKSVAHISNYRANFGGTFIKQITTVSDKIIQNEGQVVLIFPKEAKGLAWSERLERRYKVYFIPSPNKYNFFEIYTILKRIFNKENISLVHSHFDGYDLASLKAMKNKGKVIWHSHNAIDIEKLSIIKRTYAKICLYAKYKVFSNDKYMIFLDDCFRDEAINRNIITNNKSCTVTNAIDFERLKSSNSNFLKQELSLDIDKKVVLAFVSDVHRKGLDLIIKSFERINRLQLRLNLILICSESSKEFLLKIYNNNIPEWIRILEPKEDVSDYYNMADIFLSASRKETFCNAVAEAIYMGKEVISSDIDGLQWAKELPSVSFFENENSEDLYNQIIMVMKKNNNINNQIKSRNIILSKYTVDIWSDNIIKFYDIIM